MATPANVDSQLHNPEATNGNLIKERTTSTAKKSLRGAAGGTYVGPILSVAAIDHMRDATVDSHAVGAAGGGVEDSTGYRESDTYRMGTAEDAATATVRSGTGRSVYRADGVFGGSVPGYPAQRSSQRSAAATGSGLSAEGSAAAFIDKRSNIYGDGGQALGSSGRGTRVTSASGTVTVGKSGKMSRTSTARIPQPTLSGTADQNAGIVSIIAGVGQITADLHADDITGGANGLAGAVIYLFHRDTDTDEDAGLYRKGDFDTTTTGTVTGCTSLTAGTYSCYAAFKTADGNIGPWSARSTVVVS